jgi:hypothetical protein
MKPLLAAISAIALLDAAGLAAAQDAVVVPSDSTVVVPAQPASGTVVIQPEQQTVIREYVHKNPAASINILGLELSLGSEVPDTVATNVAAPSPRRRRQKEPQPKRPDIPIRHRHC